MSLNARFSGVRRRHEPPQPRSRNLAALLVLVAVLLLALWMQW
jgi:hypothetical protein